MISVSDMVPSLVLRGPSLVLDPLLSTVIQAQFQPSSQSSFQQVADRLSLSLPVLPGPPIRLNFYRAICRYCEIEVFARCASFFPLSPV
jgi:hypothetical protein